MRTIQAGAVGKLLLLLIPTLAISACSINSSVPADSRTCDKLIGRWAGDNEYPDRGITVHWKLSRNQDGSWAAEHHAHTLLDTNFVQTESGTWSCDGQRLFVHTERVDHESTYFFDIYKIVKADRDENVLEVIAGPDDTIGEQFTAKREVASEL